MVYYLEKWEAQWVNPDRRVREDYQFTKYPFQNPHRIAKRDWAVLRGKQFEVKFCGRDVLEGSFSINAYRKAKQAHDLNNPNGGNQS